MFRSAETLVPAHMAVPGDGDAIAGGVRLGAPANPLPDPEQHDRGL